MARNFRALGEGDQARKSLVWGGVATAVLVALVLVLPEGTPNGVIPIAYTLVMGQIAHKLQGAQISAHVEAGGRPASSWLSAGVGCLGLVTFIVLGAGLFMALPEDKLEYWESDLYWEQGATEEQARLVGDYMVDIGVFAPDHSLDIIIAQPKDTLQLEFTILERGWEDPDTVQSFQNVATWVSQGVLDGAPVEVRMCNDFGIPKKVLKSGFVEPSLHHGVPTTR